MPTKLQKNKHHSENSCMNLTAAGRQCRLPRAANNDSLCQYHAQKQLQEQLQKKQAAEVLAADILGPIRGFRSASAINLALGRLFILSARDRVAPRQAGALAYICQLLLSSLPLVRQEAWDTHGSPDIEEVLCSGEKVPTPTWRR